MANQRMANSDEFKEELSKAQRHERARERIANDPERSEERLSSVIEISMILKFSDKDIVMAYQGKDFGDEDYARLTGKPTGGGDDDDGGSGGGGDDGGGGGGTTPTPTPGPSQLRVQPTPGPNNPPPIFGTGTSDTTVNQDNDINSTVTGNNNK